MLNIAKSLDKDIESIEKEKGIEFEEKQKLAAKLYRKGFESEKIRKYLHL